MMFFTRKRGNSGLVVISAARMLALAATVVVIMPVTFLMIGYQLGESDAQVNPTDMQLALETELDCPLAQQDRE